jgi:hypothetical protein
VKISNRFVALENLDESIDINSAWESIRDKEILGYHRLKNNKPRLDDECSRLMDQQKQAKLQWLQNPSQINGDNMQHFKT